MSARSTARLLGCALLLLIGVFGGSAWTPAPSAPRSAVSSGAAGPAPAPAPVPEYAENGMVVSAKKRASRAGVSMLEKGGNAVDAAVATGFALAVVHPYAGNIGGGGFMVIRRPDGSVTTIDHREDAPSGATQEVYLDDDGTAVRQRSRRGHLASGVPGTVAGLLKALDEHGTLDRATVMAPAIRLAEEGFSLPHTMAEGLNDRYEAFAEFPATKEYFTKGRASAEYRPGERFVQADLARTLKRIRDAGKSEFYEGETASLIAEQFQANGGLIDEQDLAEYEAVERAPVTASYRGYEVHSMGPPSSGGVAIAQLLNAAEMKDIGRMGFNSSATAHYLGEAMRRVFADRAKWLGDPDHVQVPTEGLVQKDYMRDRMASFDSSRITPTDSVRAGEPMLAGESMETSHYSVADSSGMAVSVTTTLNSGYGSKVMVDEAGFFMNNEMNDFVLKPGVPNQFGLSGTKRNLVAPDRRMVSSMSPTIVENPDGELSLVIGAPGGSTIITTTFQVIMNVIDHGMDIEQAVTAGRLHHQWKPRHLSHEEFALSRDAVQNLRARGWEVTEGVFGGIPRWGRAQGLRVTRSGDEGRVFYGGSDPRANGAAVGL
ncbi:gamma-glutamyltransferase [Salinibacter altiplanensis]|uniref:gamma-glutamyltransferase n=1 Tax=Salinibacter altiplanensis TaxID=1803181 RepID=UPI000C9F621E|nr:gamma-glutamyltransferase [Salinibacter altiplanensis]